MVAQMAQYLVAFNQPDGTYGIFYELNFSNADDAQAHIDDVLKAQDRRAGMQTPHNYVIIDMPMGWRYGPA